MKHIISNILLLTLFVIVPFGEVLRWQFNNGIAVSMMDIVTGSILIFVCFEFMQKRNYLNAYLLKSIMLFFFICIFSLLINRTSLTPFRFFVSSLYIVRWISLTSLYFLVTQLDKKTIFRIPYYLVISGFFIVIFGYIQYFFYPNLKNLLYLGWDIHYLRLFSTFFDPNFAGIFLVLYFLLTLHIWIKTLEMKKKIVAIMLGLVNLCTCLSIFLTLSRDSFLVLTAGLITYLALQEKKKNFSILGIVVFLFVICIFFLTKLPTEGAHMFRIPSTVARIVESQHALTIISEHPVLGVGFNAYRYAQLKHGYLSLDSWESSHAAAGTDNSFLFVFATTGIFGLLLYCYLLFRILKLTFFSTSKFAIVGFSSMISLIISSLFINSLFYTPLMIWAWILLGFIENTSL